MKKRNIVIVVSIILSAIIIFGFVNKSGVSGGAITDMEEVAITYGNFTTELPKYSLVWAVPESSAIIIKFYNFDAGYRQWEKVYLIETGRITETNTDATAEIVILLHSKYLNGLTNYNFCSAIQTANANGDLGFETELSKAALAWKFKGMFEYRDCFGF